MAHEISHASGRAEIAYAGDTPWHGLGTRVEGLQTAQDMLRHAGLDWTVSKKPLLVDLGGAAVKPFNTHVALYRDDVGIVLGVASPRYQPIQNTQAADVVDALVAEGGAHVEVAGALGQGERCWMLSHIPGEFEVVRGDAVRPYFLLAWGHDGKHGLAGRLTPIRVVCNNTLTAAGFGKGQRWSASADIYVRHYGDSKLRIEAARDALGLVRRQVEATAAVYRAMAARSLDRQETSEYFGAAFPAPASEAEEYEEKLARWNAHQQRLLALYEAGAGAATARGTLWGAYNAVTEWVDHEYPVLQSGAVSQVRQQSVLFGHYAEVKRRAFDRALALVS